MKPAIGKRIWAVAEGYIPEQSRELPREKTSHEALCFLNAGEENAVVKLTIYFTDRDPFEAPIMEVKARRSFHFRINELPEVPRETEYSMLIESSVPIVVQHTRLDSRRDVSGLMTTIAYSQ